MGLDIYVMPLWRFKAGDFRSPIETALGIRPTVVTPDGISDPPDEAPGFWTRWRARRQVAAIRRAVARANRTAVRWRDEGDMVYGGQSRGMESLRAYAAWLDCRDVLPEFAEPPDGNYYEHPARSVDNGRPLSSPHLVGHDCFSGFFLPCEFEKIVYEEPYLIFNHWPASRSVGSSPRLLRELAAVAEHLRPPDDHDGLDVADPLFPVKQAYLQLREVAELSCRHGLPVIFWG